MSVVRLRSHKPIVVDEATVSVIDENENDPTSYQ